MEIKHLFIALLLFSFFVKYLHYQNKKKSEIIKKKMQDRVNETKKLETKTKTIS